MAKMKATDPVQLEPNTAVPTDFSKAHILTFKRYANRRDLLSVLLKDDQRYTLEQVDGLIQRFQTPKGKVN